MNVLWNVNTIQMLQVWCYTMDSVEGNLNPRSRLPQLFPGCKLIISLFVDITLWKLNNSSSNVFFAAGSAFNLIILSADSKYGGKGTIFQKWWSILVYGSDNSRYFIYLSSFNGIDILDNSGGNLSFLVWFQKYAVT